MKRINIKIFSSIVLIGLLAGCASNNENVSFNNKNAKSQTKVDKKISDIKTKKSDTLVKSNISEDNTNSTNEKDSYINKVVSIVNGKNIVLKSVHFGFDKYKLTGDMIDIANKNAVKIQNTLDSNSNVKIKLEGNCDEWGTDEYNYALGLKRTKSVKTALVNSGISSDKIVVVSYGESNPICTAQTAKCWKRNRRVDYKLLP